MGSLRLERTAALSLVAVAVGFAFVLAVLPLPAAASVATLHLTSGSATVSRDGGAQGAADGQPLRDGDTVTTAAGSTALMAFVDGSTLTLEPSTSVTVAEASADAASTVTRLLQTAGRTWSSVQRLSSPRSRYEIRTPALTATVRGTAFEVEVAADGATRVHVVEGLVGVANDRGEVLVGAGTQTSATPLTPPAPPAAPPPAPLRTVRIDTAPVVVVDQSGRGCGRLEAAVLQQIPGCVVRGDEIRIVGAAASAELRERDLRDPAAVADLVIVTPRPTPLPVEEIRLPLIGAVPVQPPRGTTVPIAASTAAPLVAPLVTTTLPPLPSSTPTLLPAVTPAAAPTLAVPTLPPLPAQATPEATPATVVPITAPLPTLTLAPTAVPTIAPTVAPTTAPTAVPTIPPTAIPSVAPSLVPTAAPTASPAPTAAPTPTPAATPSPTPTLVPVPSVPLPTSGVGLP